MLFYFFAILSFPFLFIWRPWRVNDSLRESTSRIRALSQGLRSFLNLLLYTDTSLLTHEFARKSNLCGALITITFVCLWDCTNFVIWLGALFASFFLYHEFLPISLLHLFLLTSRLCSLEEILFLLSWLPVLQSLEFYSRGRGYVGPHWHILLRDYHPGL